MSEYRRVLIPGGTDFFTVVTHDRLPFFADDRAIGFLRAAFRSVRSSRPFHIDAIVVPPEHLHCIWRLPEGDSDYAGRWREIKKATSRHLDPRTNRHRERPVWQRRYWEHLIRDEDDWRRHLDYVHYNPVKHGLATRPADWPWSSFRRAVARGWYATSWGEAAPPGIAGMDLE